jgi:hypothetical protein
MTSNKTNGGLSEHARHDIDQWLTKFPPDRRRSAVLAALRTVQHDNGGYLTRESMDAVADYIGLPKVQVYEVATFYSMFETKPVGRHQGGRKHSGRALLPEARRRVPRGLQQRAHDDGRPCLLREPHHRNRG